MTKYLDSTGLTYFWNQLKNYFVKKESGKGLSTNDYTTAEKSKLAGVASGAQVNSIEQVKVNGTTINPSNKAVDIAVPTKVSALTNDAGFQTASQVSSSIASAQSEITAITADEIDAIAV